jgi:hypothetical protein
MLNRLRFRPLAWMAAVGTATLTAGTIAVLLPGAASAQSEKVYEKTFVADCVVAPGLLNDEAPLNITTRAVGPETVEQGQAVTFHETTATIETPVELTEEFALLGATEVRGSILNFVADPANGTPTSINLAKPAEFPEGLPYVAPVEKGKPGVFKAPSLGRSYSFGPITATGAVGSSVELTLNTAPGFREKESGVYEGTGEGIISTASGYGSGGEKVVGPLKVVCTAPANTSLGSVKITAGTTSSSTTTTTSSTTTTTTTTKSTTTTTTTTEAAPELEFKNWILTGSLTDKKLGEKITLPAGSTFNGKATLPGPLTGKTVVPPFKASVKIFGLLPITLGVTFTEAAPITGTVAISGSNVVLTGTAKDNIGLTGVTLLGLNIPTTCKTSSAVSFPLSATEPISSLEKGAPITFNGTTTLPSINCEGGLLGSLFGSVITELMSGPGNAFTLTIAP